MMSAMLVFTFSPYWFLLARFQAGHTGEFVLRATCSHFDISASRVSAWPRLLDCILSEQELQRCLLGFESLLYGRRRLAWNALLCCIQGACELPRAANGFAVSIDLRHVLHRGSGEFGPEYARFDDQDFDAERLHLRSQRF